MKNQAKSEKQNKNAMLDKRSLRIAVFVTFFTVIGLLLLIQSRAAAPTAHFEAESTSKSGNATAINDSTASSGKALKLNGSTTTFPEPLWHADPDTDVIT